MENTALSLLFSGPWGSGKCVAPDTKIVSFDGKLIRASDIKTGDLLMGIDSTSRRVTQIYFGRDKMYTVNQSKALDYTVNSEHILTLKRGSGAQLLTESGDRRPDIINIPIKEYITKDKHWRWCLYGYRVAINFPSRFVKIDPYFLGLWLGDGSKDRIEITTLDPEIESYIYDYADCLDIGVKIHAYGNEVPRYIITNGRINDNTNGHIGGVGNKLRRWFEEYNLFRNKHIPDGYLYNDRETRLSLLAGLLDTDGFLDSNCYEITQKDKRLAEQVCYLTRSLGLRCSIRRSKKTIKKIGFEGQYYRLQISGNTQDIPVRVKRKKVLHYNKRVNPSLNGIKGITPCGIGDYIGFTLDGDGYFLLEDFTVLHNTHLGAVKAYIMGAMYPNNCVALVRKKRVDLKPTLWKWFTEKVLPPGAVIEKNDTELYRKIVNGSEFYGIGLDSTQDVNKLASREYGFIVVEEAKETNEQDFDEKIVRCLRLPTVPFHQLLLLTNPGAPSHYLYQRFYMQPRDGYAKIEGTILPDLPPSYQKRLNQLKGIYRERYVEGKWTSFEGLVYPFDPGKHIIPRFEIPRDGRRVIVVDFGFDHPFVCQWWYVAPDDKWYRYREIYHSQRTVRAHSFDIKKYCVIDGIEPEVICDHDAEGMATLRENGIRTIPAKKDRLAGQEAVYDKFMNDQIFFFEDSLVEVDQRLQMEGRPIRTEDEFASYIWANLKTKEDMVKEKDHGMDAMRYAIYTFLGVKARRKGKVFVG